MRYGFLIFNQGRFKAYTVMLPALSLDEILAMSNQNRQGGKLLGVPLNYWDCHGMNITIMYVVCIKLFCFKLKCFQT